MNTKEIISLLKTGTAEQIKSFIESAPNNSMKELALGLVGSSNLANVIIALSGMIIEYCNGKNPEFGANLAAAAHSVALEIYHSEPDNGGLLLTTLTNLAYQHLNALNYLGRAKETLKFANDYLGIPEYSLDKENYPSLVTAKANALLNLNRIDECKSTLENLDCSCNLGAKIEKDRLLFRVNSLMASATSVTRQESNMSLRNSLLDAFATTNSHVFDDNPEMFEGLKNVIENEQKNRSLDPDKLDDFEQMLKLMDQGEAFLSKGNTDNTELRMRKKCRDANAIFHPGFTTPPSPQQLKLSLSELTEVYEWAKENDNKDLLQDSIWGRYLCHSRLNHDTQAADALIELRTRLEAQRSGITDPINRGGAFSTYPQLFNALCEKLQKTERYFELLESMEAAKGRAIADILTRKQNRPVADADVYGAVSKLPQLTKRHKFNYLSLYVDRYAGEAIIYMVMVCKDGVSYGIEPARISESLINSALLNIDPATWGKPLLMGRKTPNASEILQPLTKLIEDLYQKNIIAEGDHICYTADEQINNVPLHYLPFKGKLLIDYFSISRIHNASQLQLILEQPPQLPDHATVFVVPTQQDTNSDNWLDFERNISRPAAVLSKYLTTDVLTNQQASYKSLLALRPQHSILHFSTHGIFEISGNNPYSNSGLVLSDGISLPDKNQIARGDLSDVMTPQKVVEGDVQLKNSHVSMMACVSGRSREGIGGDALGLDWALVNAGVRSILSSHWFIRARQAADFFDLFYEFWLGKKQSKAMAFKNTVNTLQIASSSDSTQQWAAFSLSGDWR